MTNPRAILDRAAQSDGEAALETLIRWEGLPEPLREFEFWPNRKFRFDFAWPERLVAMEVEGGTWTNGAHVRGRHFESDLAKYNEAALRGWKVLRVTTEMARDGRAVELLRRALR